MEDYSLIVHAVRVQNAIKSAGPVVLKLPRQAVIWGRYLKFMDALSDWVIACQKYDTDYREYDEARRLLQPLLVTQGRRTLTADEEKIADRRRATLPHLRFDIRCFYIFSKIAYIAFFGLLFSMAGEKSQDWKQARRFVKRARRSDSKPIVNEFERQFHEELEWFLHHVNFYRNDFIEHPVQPLHYPGLITSASGAQIAGLTGRGLGVAEEVLLANLQRDLKGSFPNFATLTGFERYEWIVNNKEKLPEAQHSEVEAMIRNVGLQTPPLGETAAQVASTLERFLMFFFRWRQKGIRRMPA